MKRRITELALLAAALSAGNKMGAASYDIFDNANGIFIPSKHPIATPAMQKREAKKRKNISKHK